MTIKELPPLPPLPEPDSYLFQHEETGQTMFVDSQQVEWGFEKINPRLKKISGAFTEAQLRDYALQVLRHKAPSCAYCGYIGEQGSTDPQDTYVNGLARANNEQD